MLIVYHNYHKIISVVKDTVALPLPVSIALVDDFQQLALRYPEEFIVWCALEVKEYLNEEQLKNVFHHNLIMASFTPDREFGIHSAIGYIDSTPFVKTTKEVTYPTWLMSALVGGIHAQVIINFSKEKNTTRNFELYLNLMARKGMWQGLCCYSEPLLLTTSAVTVKPSESVTYSEVFRFVNFHYKTQWLFYLLFSIVYFDRKFPFLSFFSAFFTSKAALNINLTEGIRVSSTKKLPKAKVDVLIPTIGRKKYLYDVLCDLKAQTCLPHSIIIVEQNPLPESVSELDYLTKEEWPFEINHIFTHQAGACNARNLALDKIIGDWVFFADDDIRIAPDFLEKALQQLQQYGQTATTLFCHRENEKPNFDYPLQWGNFGSGCSIVLAEALKELRFDMRYEFGFGEDGDFGVQLRNTGTDVFYFPKPDILHLKAPVGGFRTKPVLAWEKEALQPKPSPTVLLYQLKNLTLEQQRSEKVKLFMNFYKHQPIKNPLRYLKVMNQQWEVSRKWALKLLQHD